VFQKKKTKKKSEYFARIDDLGDDELIADIS